MNLLRKHRFLLVGAASLQLVLLALALSVPDARGAGRASKARGDMQAKLDYCKDCHGRSAQGFYGYFPIPRLAGQQPEYLKNQLQAFIEHRRTDNIMFNVAHSSSPAMIDTLAADFRELNPPPLGGGPRRSVSIGEKISPAWGTEWKRAVVRHYNHKLAINNQGSVMAYRQNYLDLDPTYRDRYGRPLLRMTFDFHANEQKQANYIADICVKIGQAMGADRVVRRAAPQRYSIVPYQSTHNTGGAVLGTDPKTSALNRFTQSWDVPNVFVTGACAFPQNAGKNPTGPVGALAYWTVDAIKRYLKNPGPLVPI